MLTKETIEAWKRHPEEILSRSDAEWEQLCDLALKGLFPEEAKLQALIEKIRALHRYDCHGPEGDYSAGMEPGDGYVDAHELDKLLQEAE